MEFLTLKYLFLNINQLALNFIINLFQASTCFEHMCSLSGWCDDTRDCIIQFCHPDDEHMCSKHVEAWNKLIIKFSASSWLILRNKYYWHVYCLSINSAYCITTFSTRFTSRGQHVSHNNFLKHKNLITTILTIFLPTFDVINATLTVSGKGINSQKIFYIVLYKSDVHRAVHRNVISVVKPTRCTNVSNLFYFGISLYMFRAVFPSIISSSRLYIQQQTYVKQILLTAC